MNILGPLLKTGTGSEYIAVMTYRYSKLTEAIRTKATTATDAAQVFIKDWVIPCGIQALLMTDNESQFV